MVSLPRASHSTETMKRVLTVTVGAATIPLGTVMIRFAAFAVAVKGSDMLKAPEY